MAIFRIYRVSRRDRQSARLSVCDQVNLKYYSTRTADSCVYWARQFILFYNIRHPKEMCVPEINRFMTRLAVEIKVAVSTQNRALHAIRAVEYELSRALLEVLEETPGATIYDIRDVRRLEERGPSLRSG